MIERARERPRTKSLWQSYGTYVIDAARATTRLRHAMTKCLANQDFAMLSFSSQQMPTTELDSSLPRLSSCASGSHDLMFPELTQHPKTGSPHSSRNYVPPSGIENPNVPIAVLLWHPFHHRHLSPIMPTVPRVMRTACTPSSTGLSMARKGLLRERIAGLFLSAFSLLIS